MSLRQEAAAAAEAQLLRARKESDDLQSEVARLVHDLKEKTTQVCCIVRIDTLPFLLMQILAQSWEASIAPGLLAALLLSLALASLFEHCLLMPGDCICSAG